MAHTMNVKTIILSVGFCLALTACGINDAISTVSDLREVENARWYKQEKVDSAKLADISIPSNMARIIVIRNTEEAPLETSVNVGVNNRYLGSIQPNNFAEALTCGGVNELSVTTTGMKTNNLKANNATYRLAAGQTYYFEVSANQVGNATITPITNQQGQELIQGKERQSHQVNRVIPKCQLTKPIRSYS